MVRGYDVYVCVCVCENCLEQAMWLENACENYVYFKKKFYRREKERQREKGKFERV